MPYKFEKMKLKIPPKYDRRRKLTDEQKEEIKELYGEISQRKLAKIYGVSRRLIQFIGDPSRQARDLELRAARGGSKIYYDKEKQVAYMRKHRRRKYELYKQGELIE